MAKTFLISLFCLTTTLVGAQDLLTILPGARGGSMGGIKSVHTDILSVYGNEAGLAYLDQLSFYLSGERRFNNSGLDFYSLAAGLPTRFGSFGLLLEYYGFELYNEQLLGLVYGRKLSKQLSLGMQFDYFQVRIPTYGNKSTFTAEMGILAQINSSLNIGFHIYNPFEIKWVEDESLPSAFNIGLSFIPSENITIMGELQKISSHRENFKVGVQYNIIDQLSLRLGVNTNPSLMTFGIGYQLENGLSFDAGSSIHQQLGISPLAGFGYQAKRTDR